MLRFEAPLEDIDFLLFRVFRVEESWQDTKEFRELSADLVRAVLSEAGRLASEVMAPINQQGDAEGCHWDDGRVTTPSGFPEAFTALAEGGWLGLSGNPEFGGQGMPKALGCLMEEMFWAANPSLFLTGSLTVGTTICIDGHASEAQKATYLPKLYSGEWTGAMALTEAHAGTDLGIMRSKAEPNADGSYRITGSKIFITSGEHDLAENIVHLVLARLPDAPAGTKGISLFIVPKYLVNADGSLGERNRWASGSIEHKMGINGSPTNVINYDEATGFIVGEPNRGLASMFTMMNYERLSVGLQGLGAGEIAYQCALAYARERRQGRAPTGPQEPQASADTLLVHPDVRRMLITMRALNEAGRAIALLAGQQLDAAKYQDDREAQRFSELLTPVTKAFFTDRGMDITVLAQQVLGGHGYVREWGLEQLVRDARIGQIYEGTNGVQALDLISRKVLKDGGRTLNELLEHLRERLEHDPFANHLVPEQKAAVFRAFDSLSTLTAELVDRAKADPALPGAVSVDYLELTGLTLYAWAWARMAAAAHPDAEGASADYLARKRQTAEFFFARLLPKTEYLATSMRADSGVTMAAGF